MKTTQTNSFTTDKSTVRFSLIRLVGFDNGIYSVRLNFTVVNNFEDGKFQNQSNSVTLSNKISVKEGNVADLKEKLKDYTFPLIHIEAININSDDLNVMDPLSKSFSGTSLSYFEIELTDSEGNKYLTHKQDIIDLFIKLSTSLLTELTISKKEIDINLLAYKVKPTKIDKENHVLVKIILEIDLSVRKAILDRIYYIYKQTIILRSIIENSQYKMLKFFEAYHDDILSIIDKNVTESTKGNCNDCSCLII